MNIKLIVFVIFLILFGKISSAQKGKLLLTQDVYLDTLIKKNIAKNRISRTIDGYRIQLFSGVERNNANALKTKFLKLFPETPAYLIYQQPYFKLRVGDFRNKLEAQPIYYKLEQEFGQVIIIPDKINLPKL